ncbi:rab-GTPase-TBC domain-containing protein [Phanerochaete sordida]|uniref:Rab-GTPase-TBC domain-containing protein n=1 Tax=Phanerochaete sordida TaxID=48140 RepID=A0A9P3G5C7_9APHY|nr:rab-GTPase-TBC domain-containing protein [Phanerochaete sordida]
MDPPSLILIPPTPQPIRSLQPSPLSTNTTVSGSSLPELAPSAIDRDRSSSETTIVTIYSMYEEEEESWSTSDPHRRHPSKDLDAAVAVAVSDARDPYIPAHGRPAEDSGYYDATYDAIRPPSKLLNPHENRFSDTSDDSMQLAYTDSRPPSSYARTSTTGTGTRMNSLSESPRLGDAPSTSSDAAGASAPTRNRPASASRPGSRPVSHASSSSRSQQRPPQAPQSNGHANGSGRSPSPYSTPPLSSGPLPNAEHLHSPLLAVPSTPASSPRRPSNASTPESKHSQLSLVRSEGEDADAFHVRSTYAQLDMIGVKGDGVEEGVERTRARVGGSRQSELRAEEALGDGTEKTRELTPQEVQLLSSLDRYGFFVTPSHDRLILLPAAPLAKPLARVSTPTTSCSPSAPLLRSQPPTQPPVKELSRTAKWQRMLVADVRDEGGNVEVWSIKPSKEPKLRERTFKGIPDCWRSAAWEVLMNRFTKSGRRELRRLAEEYREALDQPSTYDVQIDLDVPRTISGNIMFRTRYGQGQRSLFHVLHCLSLRCETCGYCQGMGPIAATLLCYFDPERVYASLVRIHDAYSMHDIFSPGFPGLLEAIYVQERITEQMMPDVYAAFKKHMISTTSYATKWYITLFANSVPFQSQLRLWDAFLLEGHDIFVIVAVAIVWVYRDHITSSSANFESVLSLLSSFFVPEDENALLFWIEKVVSDKKLRAQMQAWRQEWKRLVKEGKDGSALL